MSDATEDMIAAMIRRGFPDTTQTMEWLEERLANCIRLGDEAKADERAGWAEDGAYFAKTLAIIRTLAEDQPGTRH